MDEIVTCSVQVDALPTGALNYFLCKIVGEKAYIMFSTSPTSRRDEYSYYLFRGANKKNSPKNFFSGTNVFFELMEKTGLMIENEETPKGISKVRFHINKASPDGTVTTVSSPLHSRDANFIRTACNFIVTTHYGSTVDFSAEYERNKDV